MKFGQTEYRFGHKNKFYAMTTRTSSFRVKDIDTSEAGIVYEMPSYEAKATKVASVVSMINKNGKIHETLDNNMSKKPSSGPKYHDLPPPEGGVQSRVEAIRAIYEKRNSSNVPSPSNRSVVSSLSTTVDTKRKDSRTSFPLHLQKSKSSVHRSPPSLYSPMSLQPYNYNHTLAEQFEHQQQHQNHNETDRNSTQYLNAKSFGEDRRPLIPYEPQTQGDHNKNRSNDDLNDLANIVARGYDIKTATEIQKLRLKKISSQTGVQTNSRVTLKSASADSALKQSERPKSQRLKDVSGAPTNEAISSFNLPGTGDGDENRRSSVPRKEHEISVAKVRSNFQSNEEHRRRSLKRRDELEGPLSNLQPTQQQQEKQEEKPQQKQRQKQQQTSKIAKEVKSTWDAPSVRTSLSETPVESSQLRRRSQEQFSQHSQSLSQSQSQHTTSESGSYSLQCLLDIGFSVEEATRLYHLRLSRSGGGAKLSGNDSCSPLSLPRPFVLSSAPSSPKPETPTHIRRKMISHANFIKKAVTPDPVHCDDDSTEDYGEIGTFSVTPSEPGIHLKMEDVSCIYHSSGSASKKDGGTGPSGLTVEISNTSKRFHNLKASDFPTQVLHTSPSMQSVTSSITFESFAADDEESENHSHQSEDNFYYGKKDMSNESQIVDGKMMESFESIVGSRNSKTIIPFGDEGKASRRGSGNSTEVAGAGVPAEAVFTIADELQIRRLMSTHGLTLEHATSTYFQQRHQQGSSKSFSNAPEFNVQEQIALLLAQQESQFGFNMYDMISSADHFEVKAIRERLNCDLDTAILTIFERRNRLISSCLRGSYNPTDSPVNTSAKSLTVSQMSPPREKPRNRVGYDHEGYESVLPPLSPNRSPTQKSRSALQAGSSGSGIAERFVCNPSDSTHQKLLFPPLLVPDNENNFLPPPITAIEAQDVVPAVASGQGHLSTPSSHLRSPTTVSFTSTSPSGTESGNATNTSSLSNQAVATPEVSPRSPLLLSNRTSYNSSSISGALSRTRLFFTRSSATTASSLTTNEEAAMKRLYGFHVRDVRLLMSMGFSKDQAVQALVQCDNNVEHAANVLATSTTELN